MSETPLEELAWLPPAPDDFGARCRAAGEAADGAALRALAGHRLDTPRLNRLARAIGAARAGGAALEPLAPFRLGLLSNASTELLAPPLVASAARHGLCLEVVETPFDQVVQQALDPASSLRRERLDAVLVAVDHRGLALDSAPGDRVAADSAVETALVHLDRVRDGLREGCGAPCLLQTLPRPPEPLFGSLDLQVAGSARHAVDRFNRGLAERVHGSPDLLFDVAALAETVGLAAWLDPVYWHLAKLPFAPRFAPLYADALARLLAALRGRSRKALVLDLDNTLWGGVIGDDGLEGIRLGQGSPEGEAFLEVQRMALALHARGVVLAVCSKNDDAVARAAFREHPDMLLGESHIAVFQANWSDKAGNLRAIAEALNLGLDALVFVDDNPAERARVREALPEVAVPELPGDPALYARTVLAAGYFESVAFSDDDRQRSRYYEANARRAAVRETVGDLDEYLASLEMRVQLAPFDSVGRARIAQLVNKSNQWNLTTRRYTDHEIEKLELDPEVFTLQVRVEDRFGDNGMISVVIARRSGEDLEIDTWLMSCRVIGRRIEEAVLVEIAAHAREVGARRVVGRYLPTGRNRLVEDLYPRLGFERADDLEGGGSEWTLDPAAYTPGALPLRVERAAPGA